MTDATWLVTDLQNRTPDPDPAGLLVPAALIADGSPFVANVDRPTGQRYIADGVTGQIRWLDQTQHEYVTWVYFGDQR